MAEAVERQAAVVGTGGEQDGASRDLVPLLELDDVPFVAGLERDRPVRGRGSRAELSRLCDGAAGELGAADPRREAEVVLDSSRGSRLASERRGLDDERFEALGG